MRYLMLMFVPPIMLFFAGCGTRATKLTDQVYQPQGKAHKIEILFNKEPGRPYEQIAVLEKEAFWAWTGSGTIIESLKDKARKLGGDAIILHGVRESNFWDIGGKRTAEAKGVVIKYK